MMCSIFFAACIFFNPPTPPVCIKETVTQQITRLTVGSKVSTEDALRIADCESKLGTQMENPNSSAKGIYQFTYGTWNYVCGGGDVMNNELNIKCFIKQYPLHKDWWSCK